MLRVAIPAKLPGTCTRFHPFENCLDFAPGGIPLKIAHNLHPALIPLKSPQLAPNLISWKIESHSHMFLSL